MSFTNHLGKKTGQNNEILYIFPLQNCGTIANRKKESELNLIVSFASVEFYKIQFENISVFFIYLFSVSLMMILIFGAIRKLLSMQNDFFFGQN